jgi:RHS repeat-associated protein
MKVLAEGINTFKEIMMKRAFFFQTIIVLLTVCSIAQGDIGLTINGQNPAVFPQEVGTGKPLEIAFLDSASTETSYDLTLSATGGVFLCQDPENESDFIPQEQLNIKSADLNNISGIYFELNEVAAVIRLTTNQSLPIGEKTVFVGTEIFQLVIFNILDEKFVVFGITYESLSYQPPIEAELSQWAGQAESLERLDISGEPMTMMSRGYQQQAPIWFDNPVECPDLDNDNIVNFNDFSLFAASWLHTGSGLTGDFDTNSIVDVNDLMYFCEYWLMDVGCPSYYADSLPYSTSFEDYQGYTDAWYGRVSLDYQMGWQVTEGDASVDGWWAEAYDCRLWYQNVIVDANSVVSKQFIDKGNDHQYLYLNFIPAKDQKVNLLNGSDIIASVWFASDWKIYVLKNGSYVNTNVDYQDVYDTCWYYYFFSYDYENTFTDLKFKMNWLNNTYEVYWNSDPNDIAAQSPFDKDYAILTAFQTETVGDWGAIDSVAIGEWTSPRPYISITSPCACDTDIDLKGRVPIIGTTGGNHFGKYELYFSPPELAFTSQGDINWNNWYRFAEGTNVVNNGILGYWDTSGIPNGYYHVAVIVYDDLDYPEGAPDNYFLVVTKTLSIGGQVVYEGPGYFPVVGDLKCNTFYHEEEPEISVPWAGTFPFEFRRIYNNNNRFYSKPLRYGWTHNNQIKLIEDCRYNWETRDSGPFLVPAWDDNMLGFGYIWIQYPDGARKLFRNENPQYAGSTTTYRPWPEDNTGDYIQRTSDEDFLTIRNIYYTLYTRDGIEMDFSVNNLSIPWGGGYGSVGWKVEAGISSMSDRFDNTLYFNWSSDKIAVTSVSDGRATIEFDLQNGYYTEARLLVGQTIHRRIQLSYSEPVFTVTRIGKGVNGQGVYDAVNNKQYSIRYEYDINRNLRKITNGQAEMLIAVNYDSYGRVQARRDYIEPEQYLETTYTFTFIDPNLPEAGDYLRTVQSTPARCIVTLQNDKGATLSQQVITLDGSAATTTELDYTDSANPLKPTEAYEIFDGLERYSWNDYSGYGDLVEQQMYVDDSNFIATELSWHPKYSLEASNTSWQGLNKSGQKVQKLSIYGNANGTENAFGNYLVAEKVLLDDGDPNELTDDLWAVTRYTYYNTGYKKGLVKEITDPAGFVTLIEYDDNGYKTCVRNGTDPNNAEVVERYHYDAIGQLVLEANSLGGVVRHDYDDFGRLYRTRKYEDLAVMSRTDPNSYTQAPILAESRFGYNEQGFRTYEKAESGSAVYTVYTFNGLPSRMTFDDNSFIEFSYDTHGNKIQEYRYEAASQQDWYVTFGYDSMDRLTETNWFDYDDTTLEKRQLSDYWGTSQKKYDEFYGYGGVLEKKVGYSYDILTRPIAAITDPDGLALTVNYDYDAAGNRISIIDPKGSILYTDYDNANRKTAECFAVPNGIDRSEAVVRKVIQHYDNNKVLSETEYDYNDSTVLAHKEFGYDGRERLTWTIQQIDAQNDAVTHYYYTDATADPNDPNTTAVYGLIVIEDAEEKQTTITLDGFGRQLIRQYPSGDYEAYRYNGSGTLWQKTVWDPNGVQQWVTYGYDGYGRLLTTTYPDNGTTTQTWDGFGRKTNIVDSRNALDNIGGTGEIVYIYDVLGRIVSYTDQDGYTLSYAYRHDGQKQNIIVKQPGIPAAKIYDVQYSFDSANRPEYIWDGFTDILSGYIAKLAYDDNGNRDSLSYYLSGSPLGNVVTVNYAYNSDNYLRGFSTTGGPTFSFDASQSGAIDGLGRLVSAGETIGGTSHSVSYGYDGMGQLTAWQMDAVQYGYRYDNAGNVQDLTIGQNITNYGYTGDLMTAVGSSQLSWDNDGRLKTNVSASLVYNWDGKLQSAASGGNSISCTYDPTGNRIYKSSTVGSTTTNQKYIVDIAGKLPVVLVIISDPNDGTHNAFYYANSQVLSQRIGTNKYFYLHDRLGSVRAVINASGSIVNSYTYDPFGADYSVSETVYNPFGFTGQWYDSEIGQYYLRARMYDPQLMRFTSRDPIKGMYQEPMTLHQYLYCLNDPINATDPSGEFLDMLFGTSWGAQMRASAAAGGAKAMAYAGRIYAAAFYRAVVIHFTLWQFMNTGRLDLGFFRSEWGSWGNNSAYRYHFHLPWGPGLGNKHLPYDFYAWWRNFSDLYFRE